MVFSDIQLLVKLLLSREKYILLTRISNKALYRKKKSQRNCFLYNILCSIKNILIVESLFH